MKHTIAITGTITAFVEVEIDSDETDEDELKNLAIEKFEENPRSFVVRDFVERRAVGDPKDFQITD